MVGFIVKASLGIVGILSICSFVASLTQSPRTIYLDILRDTVNYFHLVFENPYSWRSYIPYLCLAVITYLFYVLHVSKTDKFADLGDLGYIGERPGDMKKVAEFVRRFRKVGSCPPAYPNGWYGLIESHRIPRGQVKPLTALGKSLAVFRDEQGVAHIFDAYCPHLGANLAVGGRVVGDCLKCPFHGWEFRGEDGKCMHIPALEEGGKIPDTAKVRSHIIHEINGWIYFWFDAEGRAPSWKIPEVEEITRGEWTYGGRTEHMINSHIQELPENGADIAHLEVVHGASFMAGIDLRFMCNKLWSFTDHEWNAEWSPVSEEEPHLGQLRISHVMRMFGIPLPFTLFRVVATQIGPAFVYMTYDSIFGKGMYFHNVLPIEPLVQRLTHNIYTNQWTPNIVAKILMYGEANQVERDIMIWNNKTYQKQPVFVKTKEDTMVAKHRRWYSQFYSENSPRILASNADILDW